MSDPSSSSDSWYERLLHVFSVKPKDTLRNQLNEALDSSPFSDSTFSPLERSMLKNILGLNMIKVDDVMKPRTEIVAISINNTLSDLIQLFKTCGHSRVIVFEETIDDALGMIHIRDLVGYLCFDTRSDVSQTAKENSSETSEGFGADSSELTQWRPGIDLKVPLLQVNLHLPVLFIPPTMPAIDLLVKMQTSRTHLALVIDEYGSTDGLISIEDLIEKIVGDIQDEHDQQHVRMVYRTSEKTFVVDARASLEELTEATQIDFIALAGDKIEEIETIGGFIITLIGYVPGKGEIIKGPKNLVFNILDADPLRIKKLQFYINTKKSKAIPQSSSQT